MKFQRQVLSMLTLAVSIVLSSNCGKNSPVGPSGDVEESATAASVSTPGPAPVPEVSTPGCEEDATAVVKVLDFSASEGTMTAKNTGRCTHWVGLSAYLIPDSGPQQFFSEDFKELAPGAQAMFKVALACGDNQVDASAGLKKSPGNGPNGVPNFARVFLPVPQFGGNFTGHACTGSTPPPPPPVCANYQAPTITGDIATALSVDANQVTITSGTVAPAGGTFNPTLPQTVNRPNPGQPAGSFSTTYTLGYGPSNLSCTVSRTFTKSILPKGDSCANYQAPTITLTPNTTLSSTQLTVNSITANPAGGTYDPTVPQTYSRPAFGQPAQTHTFVYTLSYSPAVDLQCTATKPVDVSVPPQEQQQNPCDGVGTPTFSMTKSEASTTAVVDSKLIFAGGFTGSISISPVPASGFSGGSVVSGADNNSTYNRPNWDQSSLTVNGSWQVHKGESLCGSGSGSVNITPKDRTCGDVNLHASVSVSGTSATITATWNGSGSASITIASTTKTINSSGGSVTFTDLAPGNYNPAVSFNGGLGCSTSVSFTIAPPVCSSEWDRSSYDNPVLNCSTYIASLHNGGSGPGLCPVSYHVQKAALTGQPNWATVLDGTMPAIGAPGNTGTVNVSAVPPANGSGKYRVVFDQHPAHPGGSQPTTNSCTYAP